MVAVTSSSQPREGGTGTAKKAHHPIYSASVGRRLVRQMPPAQPPGTKLSLLSLRSNRRKSIYLTQADVWVMSASYDPDGTKQERLRSPTESRRRQSKEMWPRRNRGHPDSGIRVRPYVSAGSRTISTIPILDPRRRAPTAPHSIINWGVLGSIDERGEIYFPHPFDNFS